MVHYEDDDGLSKETMAKIRKYVMIGAAALILLIIWVNSVYIVRSNERAVLSTFGRVESMQGPGLHFKIPFMQSKQKYTLVPQEIKLSIAVGPDAAVSSDMQEIGVTAVVNYCYEESALMDIARSYNEDKVHDLIKNAFINAVKCTIGQYTIYELVQKSSDIRALVNSGMIQTLGASKVPVRITQLTLDNWNWPDSFNEQIAETMKKKQQVEQEKQNLLIATQQAQKQVVEAQAGFDAAKLDADAKRITADAQAYENSKVAANLDVQIKLKQLDIEAARVAKWDGHYVANNNYGPIPVQSGTLQGTK